MRSSSSGAKGKNYFNYRLQFACLQVCLHACIFVFKYVSKYVHKLKYTRTSKCVCIYACLYFCINTSVLVCLHEYAQSIIMRCIYSFSKRCYPHTQPTSRNIGIYRNMCEKRCAGFLLLKIKWLVRVSIVGIFTRNTSGSLPVSSQPGGTLLAAEICTAGATLLLLVLSHVLDYPPRTVNHCIYKRVSALIQAYLHNYYNNRLLVFGVLYAHTVQ